MALWPTIDHEVCFCLLPVMEYVYIYLKGVKLEKTIIHILLLLKIAISILKNKLYFLFIFAYIVFYSQIVNGVLNPLLHCFSALSAVTLQRHSLEESRRDMNRRQSQIQGCFMTLDLSPPQWIIWLRELSCERVTGGFFDFD